ncbi:MAG: TSUP family transporter, partial [Actinomycetota bacterium]
MGLELEVGAVLAVAAAAWLGGVAQSTLGFGAAFTTVPALALVAPELLPGSMVLAIIPLAVTMVVFGRSGLDRPAVVRITLGRLPGIAAGAVIVAFLPTRGLTAVIAVLLLAAVVSATFGWEVAVTGGREVGAGFLSGVTGTAAALGGPPLALLY